ncbi:hypothetical protein B296_00035625 [Ensete ventricosum]|uniref:Uncharacterized protein n=1 Tax=Ensete ventricosum TaxID=4639 RepID=A0A426XV77_ENSVE|nr:hypothetical protein B296_00035625 [Ensete ventricosum]
MWLAGKHGRTWVRLIASDDRWRAGDWLPLRLIRRNTKSKVPTGESCGARQSRRLGGLVSLFGPPAETHEPRADMAPAGSSVFVSKNLTYRLADDVVDDRRLTARLTMCDVVKGPENPEKVMPNVARHYSNSNDLIR